MAQERLQLDGDFREARLLEGAQVAGRGGHVVEVTLIRAGISKNGNHYPAETLAAAAPLFERVRAFADHHGPSDRPERSVRDLVGYYRNARYVDSVESERAPAAGCSPSVESAAGRAAAASGGRIVAELHLLPGQEWLWALIQAAAQQPELCGLSIDASGSVREGTVEEQTVRIVEAIQRVHSVDVVTRPSAGGSLDRIIASEPPSVLEAEGGTRLSAEERRRYAVIVRTRPDGTKEYKFPIPPRGHPAAESHARLALAMLDRSDLSAAEKEKVRAAAAAVLGDLDRTRTMTSHKESTATMRYRVKRANGEEVEVALVEAGDQVVAVLAGETERAVAEPVGEDARGEEQAMPYAGLMEELKRERCERQLDTLLRESRLPQPVVDKLRRRYAGRIFEVETVSADIAEERVTLARLTDSGVVRGHNYEKPITIGLSEYEQLQAAFDALFDIYESDGARALPRLGGIREAFRIATGSDIASSGGADRPLREVFASGLRNYVLANEHQLAEAEFLLREADVTTASFSYLLGTSMNKRLLRDYQAWPSEWQKFCSVVAIKDFKQQDRIRLGAFGSLSTVPEDSAYTTLTISDTRATYTPAKRGNLVQISRETIINDDLYAIRQIPQKLAVAAAFTLAEFVYEFFDPDGGNIYDGHKLFDAVNHGNSAVAAANLGVANSGAALSSQALQEAVIAMRKQKNMAGKPIGLKPRYLLVCPDLEFVAMTILKSAGLPGGSNNDINPMMGYCEPIVSPQCNGFAIGPTSTTTFCAAIADPRVIDTIEIGFVGGQVNPVLFIQDQPLYGLNFTQDVISYKVRHEYGGAVVDYRGFYLINN
jgi:hypothetical protein